MDKIIFNEPLKLNKNKIQNWKSKNEHFMTKEPNKDLKTIKVQQFEI